MISIEDNGLFEIFPAIQTISEAFEYQNAMLNKIVLTGKINALEIAENLFNFTEQTAKTFTELQAQIVLNLLKENKNELFLKAKTKSQIAIDTLMKNISLRKADIDLLSKDKVLKSFVNGEVDLATLKDRLKAFLDTYSIYNEIMILDRNGHVKINLNSENKVRYSKDKILQETLKIDEILVEFRKTDLFIKQKKSLFYTKKLSDNIILVAFLKFEDETKRIFKHLITDNEVITITDKFNNILASSEKGIDKSFLKGIKKLDEFVITNNMFHVKTKSNFDTFEWFGVVSYKRGKDINVMTEFTDKTDNQQLAQISLNNQELQKLADDGYSILEDLSDVIINGELIAAKSKQYILIPILDNLREVSFRIVKLIELSISNLQQIIDDSLTTDSTLLSNFIADNIVRNLYERCNEIKWWSIYLSNCFDDSNLSNIVQYINNLYPNYSDIFVFDKDGVIKAISNSKHFIGEKIEHNATGMSKELKCFVTDFQKTKFYDDKTYIYFENIIKNNEIIGGIGAVFDSKKEFGEMLNNAFLYKKGIGLIVDIQKKILSSTSEDISGEFNLCDLKDGYIDNISFNNKIYKISISKVTSYREYKNNKLYSVVLLEK